MILAENQRFQPGETIFMGARERGQRGRSAIVLEQITPITLEVKPAAPLSKKLPYHRWHGTIRVLGRSYFGNIVVRDLELAHVAVIDRNIRPNTPKVLEDHGHRLDPESGAYRPIDMKDPKTVAMYSLD